MRHMCPMCRGTRECTAENDSEEMLNKVISVFFACKKYSSSFIKLWLNYMDYFRNVLTTFLGLERVSCVAVYAGSENSVISSKIS